MPLIPAENHEFEVSLGYIVEVWFKKKKRVIEKTHGKGLSSKYLNIGPASVKLLEMPSSHLSNAKYLVSFLMILISSETMTYFSPK
jgi:hypothetical protein